MDVPILQDDHAAPSMEEGLLQPYPAMLQLEQQYRYRIVAYASICESKF